MTLVKSNPVRNDIRHLSHLMDEFFGKDMQELGFGKRVFRPAVNIKENKEGYHIELMVPGLSKDVFSLELDKNVLHISFEASEPTADESVKVLRKEFSVDSFKRAFTLPNTADVDGISASYEAGILTISVPKKPEAAPKVISVG